MEEIQAKPVEILLIEDNPGDIILTKEAFSGARIHNNINIADDGEKGLAYLRKEGDYLNAITPNLILLDLNLPKKDGRQILKEIKEDNKLRRIPVVILTSSKAEQDILKTYDLHANSYLIKPFDFEKFSEIVTAIENFWFSLVVLPSNTAR